MAKDKAVIPRSETEDFAAEVVAEKHPQKQRYKKTEGLYVIQEVR